MKNKGKWIPQETTCTSSIVKYWSEMWGININIVHKPHGVFNYYPIIVNIKTGLVEDLHDNILLWGVDEKTCVNKTADYIFKNLNKY